MVWRGPNPLTALAAAWRARRRRPPRAGAAGPRRTATAARETSSSDPAGTCGAGAPRQTADFVYTGAQIIDPTALRGFPDGAFSLNAVWDALIADNRLRGIVHPGGWADVGRPEGIALAEAELAR